MADTVPITAGSGTSIATDDIGGVHYQRVKIAHGVDGVATETSIADPFPVETSYPQHWFEVDVPGVGNALYAAGEQFGTIITITNAARVSGGGGFITGIEYYDNDDVMGAIDIVVFDSTVTLAADNAAYAVSDADGRKTLAIFQMTYLQDMGAQRIGQLLNMSVAYQCTGTSLFAAIITRTTPTPTGGATGQHIRFSMIRD